MEEEQNQPEVLQELLLKLINDLQILKEIQQEKKKPTAQSSIPYWNSSMIDDEEARDNFLKDVRTFLRKFSRDNHLLDITKGILFARYSTSKAITPDLPIEEPDNSLSMGDEHRSTIPNESTSIRVKCRDLVPIPSDLRMTIPSHLSFGLFSHFSPTPRFLFYLALPGVKIRSLTPHLHLDCGISSECTGYAIMDKIKKVDKWTQTNKEVDKERENLTRRKRCDKSIIGERFSSFETGRKAKNLEVNPDGNWSKKDNDMLDERFIG
ncbi:hypothetical protein Tco_0833023 [Tanacetum coccineum]